MNASRSPAAAAARTPGAGAGGERAGRATPGSRPRDGLVRHCWLMLATAMLLALFWRTRFDWDPEMRLWRAFGDASIVLLFAVLALGPAARFSSAVGRLLPWRRQIGIWAAVTAFVHTFLVLNGWVRWEVARFLGFEFVPQLGYQARMEPGFGLANLIGLVAVLWLLALAVTSTDRAVRLLGPAAWKWLHSGAYTIFYLSVLHSAYFLFLHYTLSFHRDPPPPNWFRMPLLILGALVLALQWAAFVATVRRRRAVAPSKPR
jgi:sulfoxide reductase heme-binding subunit YedZ